jgi:hypothetical protein
MGAITEGHKPMTNRKARHRIATQRLSRERFHLNAEIRLIQHRAAEHEGRVVGLGSLLLFSTNTGDAWILDPADQLAARLARDGDPLAVYVEESESKYAIGWQGHFRIDGDLFEYEDNEAPHKVTIHGYPISLLLQMIEKLDHQ